MHQINSLGARYLGTKCCFVNTDQLNMSYFIPINEWKHLIKCLTFTIVNTVLFVTKKL